MRYAALDLSASLPAARSDSSRLFTYGRRAHLAAISAEAAKRGPTAPVPPSCGRIEYLHGFTVREELRRRGLLVRPEVTRRPARAHAA